MSDDLTDEELPGYATLHCDTDVAAFRTSHFARLLRLAGMNEDAAWVEEDGREFWYLGASIVDPIVARIRERT